MPCMKCSNGKYKYGLHGNCQFDTLAACKKAAAAIHIQEGKDLELDDTQYTKHIADTALDISKKMPF